ncbi:sulfatase [Neorhodopirellula lusitana]|uniref:sulfatase n=1 Tax=Neorhodopirellula lusitana TaxID=445327 RepID=UPI0038509B44
MTIRLVLTFIYNISLLFLSAVSPHIVAADRPNVLFIAIDDLNSCLGRMDGEFPIGTPNLDALADRGVLFTNAHCAAPACNPSRASVMTGVAPAKSGVYLNSQDWRENSILIARTTLPQSFRDNGYKTLGGGKLYHASTLSENACTGLIDARPWDEYFPSKTRQLVKEVVPDQIPTNGSKQFYRGYFDWAALDIEPEEMGDAKVVDWAEQQLSKEHDAPLFLAVGLYRPHIPWYTPRKYFDMHPLEEIVLPEVVEDDLDDVPVAGLAMRKQGWHQWLTNNGKWKEAVQGYAASVSFADDMVGRLIAALDDGPNADNTIIVLWSDHGYHLGQKEHWEKFALWEQTTRVPLIVAVPGDFQVGEICRQPASLLDIYPTLNELCATDKVEGLDGVSLVSLLKDPKQKTKRSVVCTHGMNNHAVRSVDWRYIRYADGSEELYNQQTDAKNFYNLANSPEYDSVKRDLSVWLPTDNAVPEPTKTWHKKSRTQNQ